jgi:hypothetical protein
MYNGLCFDYNRTMQLGYDLIDDGVCTSDTRFYATHNQLLSSVWNNNGALYTGLTQRYPFLNFTLQDKQMKLGLEYSISRATFSCLLFKYSTLFKYYPLPEGVQYDADSLKIERVLFVFTKLPDQIFYGKVIQIIIMAINALLVVNQIVTCLIALINELRGKPIHYWEGVQPWINLGIDFGTLALALITYFVVSRFLVFLITVLHSGCVDGFALDKLEQYNKQLAQVIDQNLQYIIFIGFRILVIIYNVIMLFKSHKGKVSWKDFFGIIAANVGQNVFDHEKAEHKGTEGKTEGGDEGVELAGHKEEK